MLKKITQRDVAREAKVSQAAVSRVIAKNGYVAEKVRLRITKAAAKLGYRLDPAARSLITGKSNIIAIVAASLENPFFPVVLEKLTEALRKRGKEVLLFNASHGQEIDELIPDVLSYRVAGIIVTAAALTSRASEMCDAAGIPVVMFHRYSNESGAYSVACDSKQGGRDAANLLLDAGCHHIALIGGEASSSPNRDRSQGFSKALSDRGERPVLIADGAFSYEWGSSATLDLFAREPQIDGIFCGDDAIAFGAIDALRYELGLRVPDDVSVVGFDDVPQASWASYRLTTIRQPLVSMIDRALAILEKPNDYERLVHIIPGEIVLRNTLRK